MASVTFTADTLYFHFGTAAIFRGVALRLPDAWFGSGVAAVHRSVDQFGVLSDGRVFIDLHGLSDGLLASIRPKLDITLTVPSGSSTVSATASGIADATEPYRWTPSNAADWRAVFQALPTAGSVAGVTLEIEERLDIPFAWRAGLRFAEPLASVKALPADFRLGLQHAETLAPVKALPADFRLGLQHAEPLAPAKARAGDWRAGLRFLQPRTDKVGAIDDLRIGLRFAEPEVRRFTVDNADPLRIGLRFAEPRAEAKAAPDAFRLGLAFPSPGGGRAAAAAFRAGLGFGSPSIKIRARPDSALRFGLGFGEPFAGSLGERLNFALRASAPFDRIVEFVELRHPSAATPVRLVNDTENVTLNGEQYIATRFEARLAADEGRRAPTAELLVGNVGRAIDQWVSLVGGGAGGTMRYFEALASYGATPEFEIEMDIADIQTDSLYVTISLGYDPLLGRALVARQFDPVTAPGLF